MRTEPLLPARGLSRREVRRRVALLTAADRSYRDGSILNSLCSTPLEISREVFVENLESNVGDNRIFPGVREADRRVTAILGGLLGEPAAQGGIVSGGTEANFLALAAAVRAFRERHPGVRPALLAGANLHFSFEKAAALLDVDLVQARIDASFRTDAEDLRRRVGSRTALVVATAGSSEFGAVDDVPAIAAVAAAEGIPCHVDAATGGFLVPFARSLGHPLPPIGFDVPGVTSITLDPHKYGGAHVPAGCLLFRDRGLFSRLDFESHYQGTHNHWTLLGTRPGAAVLAAYASLLWMGWDGYQLQVAELFAHREHLIDLLREHRHALTHQPDLTIVGIRADASALGYLERHGIIASRSKRHDALRIVIHRHVDRPSLERLVEVLDAHARGGLRCA